MDRYSLVKSGKQNEWLSGSPASVDKYNILKDNFLGKYVIQLQFISLSDKQITALEANVFCCNSSGETIDVVSAYYGNLLSISKGTKFGSKSPVETSRGSDFYFIDNIKVVITRVAFADNTMWENKEGEIGILLPEQKSAEAYFGELYSYFKSEADKIKAKSDYVLNIGQGYWQCTCGQGNSADQIKCSCCNADKNDLIRISDKTYLENAKNKAIQDDMDRLRRIQEIKAANEKAELEKQMAKEQQYAESMERLKREQRKELKKKSIKAFIIFVVIVIIIAFLISNKDALACESLMYSLPYNVF